MYEGMDGFYDTMEEDLATYEIFFLQIEYTIEGGWRLRMACSATVEGGGD